MPQPYDVNGKPDRCLTLARLVKVLKVSGPINYTLYGCTVYSMTVPLRLNSDERLAAEVVPVCCAVMLVNLVD